MGADKSDMRVECFPGIRADQLRRVIQNRDLGCSEAVVIHVGTNDVRSCRNLDYIMGDVYDLVNTEKGKIPGFKIDRYWCSEKQRGVVAASQSGKRQIGMGSWNSRSYFR